LRPRAKIFKFSMPDKLLIFSRLFVDNDNCLQYSSRVLLLLVIRHALFGTFWTLGSLCPA